MLYQNTPNPFKEQTVIRFSLADDARDAAICIFDMTGKILKKLPISSGKTSVSVKGWELGDIQNNGTIKKAAGQDLVVPIGTVVNASYGNIM